MIDEIEHSQYGKLTCRYYLEKDGDEGTEIYAGKIWIFRSPALFSQRGAQRRIKPVLGPEPLNNVNFLRIGQYVK